MPFYERESTRIYYEEVGSGFPLLVVPGGGLNSVMSSLETAHPCLLYTSDAADE